LPPTKIAPKPSVVKRDAPPKERFIYVVPFGVVASEARWAYPVYQLFKSAKFPKSMGCGFSIFEGDYSRLRTHFKKPWSLDWSGFDWSVTRMEIDAAYNIIKLLCPPSNQYDERVFEGIRSYHLNTKITYGEYETSDMGILSGMAGTHVLDTIIAKLRILYIFQQLMLSTHYGDDTLIDDPNIDVLTSEVAQTPWRIKQEASRHGIDWLGLRLDKTWEVVDMDKRLAKLCIPLQPDKTVSDVVERLQGHLFCSGTGEYAKLLRVILDECAIVQVEPRWDRLSAWALDDREIQFKATDWRDIEGRLKIYF
jgi:hypothetical protein